GAIWVASRGRPVIVPLLITVPAPSPPPTLGGGTPSTSPYEKGAGWQGQVPSQRRQNGDSRPLWVDTSVVPAAKRRMVYNKTPRTSSPDPCPSPRRLRSRSMTERSYSAS